MKYRDITVEHRGRIAYLTIRKPAKLNAISWSSMAEIESAVTELDADDDVRVIVITGEGRGFCSGHDLVTQMEVSEYSERPEAGRAALMRSRHLFTSRVYRCRKPTIAAVNGIACGAGLSLALACDIRIAAQSARFSAIFVHRASVADTGTSWHLPRLVGMERALRMMWTGRLVPADEALAIGLCSEVVPNEQLMAHVETVAEELARGPSLAIEMDKRLAHDALHRSFEEQIAMEEYSMNVTNVSQDVIEGAACFAERRPAVFVGR